MSSIKAGFIGLGSMGMPMARSIASSGLPLTVYDLRKEPLEEMRALGARVAGSSREVAATSDAVISMVRDVPETEEVIFGKGGVWEGMKKGGTIIISSTIGPAYCRELYAKAKARGIQVIDACVSKEGTGFEPGGLTLMIGGDEDAVKKCLPIFRAMAKHIFHLGDIGTGQLYKLVNNLAVFGCGTITRECLNLGLKAGLDLQKMIDVMLVSTGGSWSLKNMDYMMKSGMRMPRPAPTVDKPVPRNLGNKDKELAYELAEEVGANVPLSKFMDELDTESVYDAYSALMKR
jgi:3-hydroxyisobutyrate dehydrogenase-like beta-hydroxyacid dehydrogenase